MLQQKIIPSRILSVAFLLLYGISYGQKKDWDWNWHACNEHDSVLLNLKDPSTYAKLEGGWTLVKEEDDNVPMTYIQMGHHDLAFYNDTVFELNYPCCFIREAPVLVLNDTLITIWNCPDAYHVQFISWRADTLILANYYGGGAFNYSKEYYVRKNIPHQNVRDTKEIAFDPKCLNGTWHLSQEQLKSLSTSTDSAQKGIYVFDRRTRIGTLVMTDYQPLSFIDFGNAENPKFSHSNDTLKITVDNQVYLFLISEYSSFSNNQIDLIPIGDSQYQNLRLTYYKIEEE
jgi:hypothetical protein